MATRVQHFISRTHSFLYDWQRYTVGVGVGMMCANPQAKYFWVGSAWVVVGLIAGILFSPVATAEKRDD